MKPRHKRLMFVGIGVGALGIVTALLLNVFNSNMVFFFSPSDVLANKAPKAGTFRLGGMVEKESLQRETDGLTVHFKVTDNHETIKVTYKGILPDLFREGQGVIAQGKLETDGHFYADEVLAKHDEKYIAPEVADAMKRGEEAQMQKLGSTVVPGTGGVN